MNGLDMSNHISNYADFLYYLIGSEAMTPTIFTAYLKHLHIMTDVMEQMQLANETVDNNIATNATSATYQMCMKFPEFKRSDYWYEITLYHNERLLKNSAAYEDGVCLEQALGYVSTFMTTFDRPLLTREEVKDHSIYGDFTLNDLWDSLQ